MIMQKVARRFICVFLFRADDHQNSLSEIFQPPTKITCECASRGILLFDQRKKAMIDCFFHGGAAETRDDRQKL